MELEVEGGEGGRHDLVRCDVSVGEFLRRILFRATAALHRVSLVADEVVGGGGEIVASFDYLLALRGEDDVRELAVVLLVVVIHDSHVLGEAEAITLPVALVRGANGEADRGVRVWIGY